MKKILFPTDFSANAQNAYTYALHLAEKLQANITTLHAYLPLTVPVSTLEHTAMDLTEMHDIQEMEEWNDYKRAAKTMHEKAVKEHLEGVEVNHLMYEGTAVDTVLEKAMLENADMIVMGTKGASGLIGTLLGSNTASVIEQANVPVLAVPKNAQYRPIRKMAIATDFDELQEDAIAKALELAKLFNAELHCIHVNVAHNPFLGERISKLCSHFADAPKLTFEVLEGLDILKTVDEYIEENDVDILVMQTHKRTFFQKLFGVSYTKKMAFHTRIPLLSFK